MSTPVFSSPFTRHISLEINGTTVHGVVTRMLPLTIRVTLTAPHHGLSTTWNFTPPQNFLDEQRPWRMIRELHLAATLTDDRLPTLQQRLADLDPLHERAWQLAHQTDLTHLEKLNNEHPTGFAHAMSLHMRRQEEATRTFSALRKAHDDIERATTSVFTDCLPELAETEFVRCTDGARLTPFGNALWERIVMG